jgi:hypothetical protein
VDDSIPRYQRLSPFRSTLMHRVISEFDENDGLKTISLMTVAASGAHQLRQPGRPVWAMVIILAGILISVAWSGFLAWVFLYMLVGSLT